MKCDCEGCKTCKYLDETGDEAIERCEACLRVECPLNGQYGGCDSCKWEAREDES